jgi:DNA-binding YbaB/EbfC family protein
MSGFDLSNLGALMGGFQQRVAEMKAKQAALRCVGEAGGGLVRVVLTGEYQLVDVTIDPKAMADREMLEDLIKAATSEALRKVQVELQAQMQQLTGGLPIPPGLLPF